MDANHPSFLNRCRLCISDTKLSINLFEDEALKMDIVEKIKSYLSIDVSECDGLPQHICYKCLSHIDVFNSYKQSCQESQYVLKNWWQFCDGTPSLDINSSGSIIDTESDGEIESICNDSIKNYNSSDDNDDSKESDFKNYPQLNVGLLSNTARRVRTDTERSRQLLSGKSDSENREINVLENQQSALQYDCTHPEVKETASQLKNSYICSALKSHAVSDKKKTKPHYKKKLRSTSLESKGKKLSEDRNSDNIPKSSDSSDSNDIENGYKGFTQSEIDNCTYTSLLKKSFFSNNKSKINQESVPQKLQLKSPLKQTQMIEKTVDNNLIKTENVLNMNQNHSNELPHDELSKEIDSLIQNKVSPVKCNDSSLHIEENGETNNQINDHSVDMKTEELLKLLESDTDENSKLIKAIDTGITKQLKVTLCKNMPLKDSSGKYTQSEDNVGDKKLSKEDGKMKTQSHQNRLIKPVIDLKTGKMRYKCLRCNSLISYRSYINEHLKIHSGVKAYKCTICSKSFRNNYMLRGHMVVHSEERKYTCDVCKHTFKLREHLTQHVKLHIENPRYTCPVCGRLCNQKQAYERHMRIHTGERPFKCMFCEKFYRDRSTWINHVRIHTGERPYNCEHCGKKFSRLSNLRTHKFTHSSIRPFDCHLCSSKFKTKGHLVKHLSCVHRDVIKSVVDFIKEERRDVEYCEA